MIRWKQTKMADSPAIYLLQYLMILFAVSGWANDLVQLLISINPEKPPI